MCKSLSVISSVFFLGFISSSPATSMNDEAIHILEKARVKQQEKKRYDRFYTVEGDVAIDKNGNTPLHYASLKGKSSKVKKLCKNHANANINNNAGLTPLHVAAKHGHSKTLKTLIAHGGDANSADNKNSTPLHYAVYYGQVKAVKILLENGASLHSLNNKGLTPADLMWSSKQKKVKNYLLKLDGCLTSSILWTSPSMVEVLSGFSDNEDEDM